MAAILLKLSPRSELVVEGVHYVFEASEGVLRESIEPIISGSLEPGRERPTEKKVIVSINRHLILKMAEIQ